MDLDIVSPESLCEKETYPKVAVKNFTNGLVGNIKGVIKKAGAMFTSDEIQLNNPVAGREPHGRDTTNDHFLDVEALERIDLESGYDLRDGNHDDVFTDPAETEEEYSNRIVNEVHQLAKEYVPDEQRDFSPSYYIYDSYHVVYVDEFDVEHGVRWMLESHPFVDFMHSAEGRNPFILDLIDTSFGTLTAHSEKEVQLALQRLCHILEEKGIRNSSSDANSNEEPPSVCLSDDSMEKDVMNFIETLSPSQSNKVRSIFDEKPATEVHSTRDAIHGTGHDITALENEFELVKSLLTEIVAEMLKKDLRRVPRISDFYFAMLPYTSSNSSPVVWWLSSDHPYSEYIDEMSGNMACLCVVDSKYDTCVAYQDDHIVAAAQYLFKMCLDHGFSVDEQEYLENANSVYTGDEEDGLTEENRIQRELQPDPLITQVPTVIEMDSVDSVSFPSPEKIQGTMASRTITTFQPKRKDIDVAAPNSSNANSNFQTNAKKDR